LDSPNTPNPDFEKALRYLAGLSQSMKALLNKLRTPAHPVKRTLTKNVRTGRAGGRQKKEILGVLVDGKAVH